MRKSSMTFQCATDLNDTPTSPIRWEQLDALACPIHGQRGKALFEPAGIDELKSRPQRCHAVS